MSNQTKPLPHIFSEVADFKSKAILARRQAAVLTTQAEVWEEAARSIEYALEKEIGAQGKPTESPK